MQFAKLFIVQLDERTEHKMLVDAKTWRNTTNWVDVDWINLAQNEGQ